MKSKTYIAFATLLGVMVVLAVSAGIAQARRFRLHDNLYTVAERVYPNGMIFGYTYYYDGFEEIEHTDMDVDSAEVFVIRDEGDQRLFLRKDATVKGPDDLPIAGHKAPFWLVRWKDPIWPSPPLRPKTEIFFSPHESGFEFGVDTNAIITDCSEYNDGPEDYISEECRIRESAPPPSWFEYCSEGSESIPTSKTINVPAEMAIFDLNLWISVQNAAGNFSATLQHGSEPAVPLFTDESLESVEIDDQGIELPITSLGYGDAYRPEEPLAGYNGRPANGEWTLSINTNNGGSGTLTEWCLDILVYDPPISDVFLPMVTSSGSNVFTAGQAQDSSLATAAVSSTAFTWQGLDNSAASGGISNSGGDKDSRSPVVASDSYARPYVAWADNRTGDYEIYVKRWNGSNWEDLNGSASDGGISDNSGDSREPAIAFDGENNAYVAWEDVSSGTSQIYVKRWNDEDKTWESLGDTRFDGASQSYYDAGEVSIAINDKPYIAYVVEYLSSGESDIYAKYYDANTSSWVAAEGSGSGGNVSNSFDQTTNPTIAFGGNRLIVSWDEYTVNDQFISFFVHDYSTNFNSTSGRIGSNPSNINDIVDNIIVESEPSNHPMSTDATIALRSTMVIDSIGSLYVAWVDFSGLDYEIYLAKWDWDTASWHELGGSRSGGGISNNDGFSGQPAMAIGKQNNPHIAWVDEGDSAIFTLNIFSRYWDGSQWQEHGEQSASTGGISQSDTYSELPSLSIGTNGVPYVAWAEDENSSFNNEIYFKWYQWWE